MIIEQALHFNEEVKALLASEKLPTADLRENLENFLVALCDGVVVGVIGVEIYGDYGLLRSLAVAPQHRHLGIARKLIGRIEALSYAKNLHALFLLTETAPAYFKSKGFTQIARKQVPAAVQASSEFSHVCPASAIAMIKNLN